MQQSYRPFPQQAPQRSPHASSSQSRRGIGPMVSGGHPPSQLTQAQLLAQTQAAEIQMQRAKMRSKKPTDKSIPEGVENCIIGDGVQKYRELRDIERRLDATMMRKRLDIQDAVNRNVKRYRTLRVWITNTVEDQPWQGNTLDVDAFDFSSNMDCSYRVKIEGRLLDEEEEEDSDDEDEDDDAMDEDGKEKKTKPPGKQYKFSHFFKAMTVDFDRNKLKDGQEQNVEWKKPSVGPNAANLPNAADFDQLEFRRGGDENMNITIKLHRDENPERFLLSPRLADVLDMKEATRAEAVMAVWDYIRIMGLQEDDEKRTFECDEALKPIFRSEKGSIPQIPDVVTHEMFALQPIELLYTIRVDKAFHDNPSPTIYDIEVQVDDPLRTALATYLINPSYASTLREISSLNDHLALLVQKISNSKSKHQFLDAFSKNPSDFILKWLSSQKRDLEAVGVDLSRENGVDAGGDEWRRGGKNGVWGSENVRESVNLIVGARPKVM